MFHSVPHSKQWARIAQSVQQLASGWTVRGLNPDGARFSAPVETGTGANPSSYTMSTASFTGIKRPERGVDHPPPTIAEFKERIELYF